MVGQGSDELSGGSSNLIFKSADPAKEARSGALALDLFKVDCAPFLLFAHVFYVSLTKIIISRSVPVAIPILGLVFLSWLVYLLVWHVFLNPKYIYSLRIRAEGIAAQGRTFNWQEIADTCILRRMEGRSSTSYLIIFLRDGRIEKLNLFKCAVADKSLASIIEFYKGQSKSIP